MQNARSTLFTIVLAIALAAPGAAPAFARGDRLTVEDAVSLRSVSFAEIAPDGTRAVYVLSVPRTADDEPGSPYSEVWIAPLDGGDARRYSREDVNASDPRWSPDGTRIAFLLRGSAEDDKTQIQVIPVDGGEASALTDHASGVKSLRWSPDGTRIAFLAADPEPAGKAEDKKEGRDWTVVAEPGAFDRVWIVDVATRVVASVYDEPLSASAFEWTPDGKAIVFTAADDPHVDTAMMYSRLYRAPVDNGGAGPGVITPTLVTPTLVTPTLVTPTLVTPTQGKLGTFAVSPDGATLAYLGATSLNDPLPQSVFVTPMDGSEPVNLSEGRPASTGEIHWIGANRLLEVAATGTRTGLSGLDAESGARQTIIDSMERDTGIPVIDSVSVHAASGRFCAVAHRADHPRELYAGSLDGKPLRRLTRHNPDLADMRLGRAESITWFSSDALRIEGVVTYPVDYEDGRRYPLIVNPHGGPEGVTFEGWNEFAQLLAARGFVVLQPNYRGSGGRGVEFSKGDHDDLGGQEFRDILGGINLLVSRGVADGDRVGMAGWSYGGYLSAMAATHHSDRFKAAVFGAGISNWVSFTGTTDIPDEMSTVHWNRPLAENFELYWGRSPLSAIDRARTPTLIVFGADDDRVPPSQGHELHYALKKRGVPTEMVTYPRAGHGVRERAHRVDLLTRQIEWLERYVR